MGKKITTYNQDASLSVNDKFLGTDSATGDTKNFRILEVLDLLEDVVLDTAYYKVIPSTFDFENIPLGYNNCVWAIRDSHDLGGATITLPADVTLLHEGGNISNGTINFNNTIIISGNNNFLSITSGTGDIINDTVNPVWFGAVANGVVDDTSAIQQAVDTGRNVKGIGYYKTTSPITVSTYGQCIDFSGAETEIRPYFDGDTIRLTNEFIFCKTNISGGVWGGTSYQPRVGTVGAGIVVGYGGANANNCSVAGSRVIEMYGDGVRYDHGSMLNMTGLYVAKSTRDGIRCTTSYDDNNHGYFVNTHVIQCSGVGYNVLNIGVLVDNNNSRHHVFSNAKAFECGQNFYIGTITNKGSVFSELSISPDEFGTYSAGNSISVIETVAAYGVWVDNGTGNILEGYSSYAQWEHKNLITNNLAINARLEGRFNFTQTADRTFETNVSGTTGDITVTRKKGTASKRTDVFEGIIQFPSSTSELVINTTDSTSESINVPEILAGETYRGTSTTTSGGAGDSVIATLSGVTVNAYLNISAWIYNTGNIVYLIKNEAATPITLGDVTIRFVILKHYA